MPGDQLVGLWSIAEGRPPQMAVTPAGDEVASRQEGSEGRIHKKHLINAVPVANRDQPLNSGNAVLTASGVRFGVAASSLRRRAGTVRSQGRGFFGIARAGEYRKRGSPRRA